MSQSIGFADPRLCEGRSDSDNQYAAVFGERALAERKIKSVQAEKLERLRDEFAMAAMSSIITVAEKAGWHWQQSEGFLETVAKKSYMSADQMLKAREIK